MTIVDGTEDIMVITDKGVMIRFNVKSVSTTGRSTMGVHLINLDDDAKVSTIAKVEPEQPEADDEKICQVTKIQRSRLNHQMIRKTRKILQAIRNDE